MKLAFKNFLQAEAKYLKNLVFGGLDGVITTFAIVSGVFGASLGPHVVLIMGFANLVADGLSMAVGEYLSTEAKAEYQESQRLLQYHEIQKHLLSSGQDLQAYYVQQGLPEKDAKHIVALLSKNKEVLTNTVMSEHNQNFIKESPIHNALATFTAFIIFGFVPLISFIIAYIFPAIQTIMFALSGALTALTLVLLGILKATITQKNILRSGLETLIVGGAAATAAYVIGFLISLIV